MSRFIEDVAQLLRSEPSWAEISIVGALMSVCAVICIALWLSAVWRSAHVRQRRIVRGNEREEQLDYLDDYRAGQEIEAAKLLAFRAREAEARRAVLVADQRNRRNAERVADRVH